MTESIDPLVLERGSITAPAGCGKTRLITDALRRHTAAKPILVLTHTNAGVGALRRSLGEFGVPSSRYRLYTIDGWTIKLIATFPKLSGHKAEILLARVDYPSVRVAAYGLLEKKRIAEMVRATYDRLFVDEYQDCSIEQHSIVGALSEALPTVVLGDHMQAIFAFRGVRLVDWTKDVESWFAPAGKLSTPWRWKNAGAEELGVWLLEARTKLERGDPVDVRGAPRVQWIPMLNDGDHDARRKAAGYNAKVEGDVLIIGDSKSPPSQRELARGVFGATAVEAVDLRDLVEFASSWDYKAPKALDALISFASETTRGVDATGLRARLVSHKKTTSRSPVTEVERLALKFLDLPSHAAAADFLDGIRQNSSARSHRPIVFRALVRALRSSHDSLTLLEATLRERERNRLTGRPVGGRGVGSTLLLKGLEASVVVVIDAHRLDRRNLYVAMTRGSCAVVVCSPTPILGRIS